MAKSTSKGPTVNSAFQSANPSQFGRVRGSVETTTRLAAIENRAAHVKERMRAHCQKHEESWVAKQAIALWKKRAGIEAKHPMPPGVISGVDPQVILVDARRIVRARMNARLSNINSIKNRMGNAVVRNQPALHVTRVFNRTTQPEKKPSPRIKR